MSKKRFLGECQLFSSLNDAQLETVARLAEDKAYERGTTIFREGEAAEDLMFVMEGKVALQMALLMPQGQTSRKITVDVVSQHGVLGWSAIVEPHIYTLTGVVLQETKMLSIGGSKLRQLLQHDRALGYGVLTGLVKVLASRLEDTRRALVTERLLPLMQAEA